MGAAQGPAPIMWPLSREVATFTKAASSSLAGLGPWGCDRELLETRIIQSGGTHINIGCHICITLTPPICYPLHLQEKTQGLHS